MEKHIPYVFDDVVIYKPLSPTSFSNVGRTRVRTFYLGANRNGSFITPQGAEYLIQTAPTKPVVGFYNYLKEDFEGHSLLLNLPRATVIFLKLLILLGKSI